jgi:hypothetical protein
MFLVLAKLELFVAAKISIGNTMIIIFTLLANTINASGPVFLADTRHATRTVVLVALDASTFLSVTYWLAAATIIIIAASSSTNDAQDKREKHSGN